ncbi:hypothetical protein Q7689_00185 [Nocardiopsis tropica]|uniref:hypothetical protein n=1 Tax=Nocardiopsis tropica TaxID=109330 RepID=UPI002E88017B|nr:hypothetical protein [Nocardiopsis tropica]
MTPTDVQVAAVMAAIVAPDSEQPRSVAVEFQRWQLEQTIRRAWPYIAVQVLAAAPCEHGVELDMCDTWECSQRLNELDEEA